MALRSWLCMVGRGGRDQVLHDNININTPLRGKCQAISKSILTCLPKLWPKININILDIEKTILIQYQNSSKWHVKSQYQNQEMHFVSSRSKQYQDWIWSANIKIKTKIIVNILEFFKILGIFHLLWRHCYLKGTHFIMGIWT